MTGFEDWRSPTSWKGGRQQQHPREASATMSRLQSGTGKRGSANKYIFASRPHGNSNHPSLSRPPTSGQPRRSSFNNNPHAAQAHDLGVPTISRRTTSASASSASHYTTFPRRGRGGGAPAFQVAYKRQQVR